MKRRKFLTGLGLCAALPAKLRAQGTARVATIAILYSYPRDDAEGQRFHAAFLKKMNELGWTEGRNIRFEIRWVGGDDSRVQVYTKELVSLRPDAILTHSTQLVKAFGRQTSEIPIVFGGASDPVETGLVASLARPGGNITGFSTFQYANNGKWLEMLKVVAPWLTHVAVVLNSDDPSWSGRLRGIEDAASTLGVQVTAMDLKHAAAIAPTIGEFAKAQGRGLIVLPGTFTGTHRSEIIIAAAKGGLPAMYPRSVFVRNGGLVSYNADQADQFRHAAGYIDRILKGAKPGDLPIQTPTKLDLVLNLKTAKTLGLTVPPLLLAQADEVIE